MTRWREQWAREIESLANRYSGIPTIDGHTAANTLWAVVRRHGTRDEETCDVTTETMQEGGADQ